ncbi:iron transporter [Xaviernesmea oryzae]|uniref:Iron transporter n=1 Tax=Xaviernesmea oryzae TaxID=464029 RepID=A0A1Q9ARB4_9HYPH|nr:ChuX/HutX family heme-like substrate-binding protein [Xaviernesmea oryzae]OLP57972.1 iron transporter [Xaviernesmea oryzae]SEL28467.1 putative hemin transport protein [Xaviernesmea oryzae]
MSSSASIAPSQARPQAAAIRAARAADPKSRERDFAASLGISEAEFIAAYCGEGATRLNVRVDEVLLGLKGLGEVMALTRNDSVVHEKIGAYEKVVTGAVNALVLGENIDLRIFPKLWAHGFAVEKGEDEEKRLSLQFFDAAGDAVHKVHLRPASDVEAYHRLVASLRAEDQAPGLAVRPIEEKSFDGAGAGADELRARWSALKDTHEFFGMLRDLKLDRRAALHMIGPDYAWPLDPSGVRTLLERAAGEDLPIMCFVGSRGCIQIHSGPVKAISMMGPWLNIFDPTFHMHLRTDHVVELWGVRKPTKDGAVTSVEAYDAAGRLIVQFFGLRHEGEEELSGWKSLAETLPARASEAA